MRADRRVVIDTNVLISAALIEGSVPAQLLTEVLQRARLVFSRATFGELETRLWRPKFDRYVSMETRRLLLHDLGAVAHWVDAEAGPQRSRDRSDDAFIDAALAAGAALIASGDGDLLELKVVDGVSIVKPARALAIVRGWEPSA